MKIAPLGSAIALFAATNANAGTIAEPSIEPLPMPAPMVSASNFEGFYAGVMGGLVNGNFDPLPVGPPFNVLDGITYGGFAGYNSQSGDFVYGVEANAQMGGETITPPGIDYDLDYMVDVRARLGYSFGDVMAYVAGGYSMGQISDPLNVFPTIEASGRNVGAGLEVNVTDSIFVGGEYVYRALSGTVPVALETTYNTVQVKIGMRF